jgi:hypothetical protein
MQLVRWTQHLHRQMVSQSVAVSPSACAMVRIPCTFTRAGTKRQLPEPAAGGPAKRHCGGRLCQLLVDCIGTGVPYNRE